MSTLLPVSNFHNEVTELNQANLNRLVDAIRQLQGTPVNHSQLATVRASVGATPQRQITFNLSGNTLHINTHQ